jgi:hypothetical protein
VALHAGPSRAGDDHRTFVRAQAEQALARGADHLHPVEVVRLAVITAAPFQTVADGAGNRPVATVGEGCRLVHVVPETRDTRFHERAVQLAPPGARLRVGEIGEGGEAGPDGRVENFAIG